MNTRLRRSKALCAVAILIVILVGGCASNEREGGTLRWLWVRDVSSLDTATFDNWALIRAMNSPLLDLEGEGTRIVPELAAQLPEISADGKTYTLKLREGVKFSNGREIEAADVKYALERVLDPATQSPAASYFLGIEGAQAHWDGKASEVSGIRVLDSLTLQIILTKPDPTFIYTLAYNMTAPLPREEMEASPEAFWNNPIGTGPFMLEEWVKGQRVVLVRNPYYFKADQPHLDKVVYEVVSSDELAVLRVKNGEANLATIPTSELPALLADPEWKDYLLRVDSMNTVYLAMNTETEPFNNVQVRRAFNMAIDKEKLVTLGGGLFQAQSGIYAPSLPGYNPDLHGYDYDPDTARTMLAEAGYADGFDTVLHTLNETPYPKIAQAIQQDMKEVGVRAEIRLMAWPALAELAATPGTSQLVLWVVFPGFPDPQALLDEQLSCSAAAGGLNAASYCNAEVEALMTAARALPVGEERLEAFQEIEERIMEDAPWVPLYNSYLFFAHSPELEGPIFNPIHGFLLEEIRLSK